MRKLILSLIIIKTLFGFHVHAQSSDNKERTTEQSIPVISTITLEQALNEPEFQGILKSCGKIKGNRFKLKKDRISPNETFRINTERIKRIVCDSYISYTLLLSYKDKQLIKNIMLENNNDSFNAFLMEYSCEVMWHTSYIKGVLKQFKGLVGVRSLCTDFSENDYKESRNILMAIKKPCHCILYTQDDSCKCEEPRPIDLYLLENLNKGPQGKSIPKTQPLMFSVSNEIKRQIYAGKSITSFISPEGEPDFMRTVKEVNKKLGVKLIGPADIEIPWPHDTTLNRF